MGNKIENICVLIRSITHSIYEDEQSAALLELAKKMAAEGYKVTLLITHDIENNDNSSSPPDINESEIKIEYLKRPNDYLFVINTTLLRSYAVYKQIKLKAYDTVISCLQEGILYHLLTARETGVFDQDCNIVIMASGTTAYDAHVEKRFLNSLEELQSNFMEMHSVRLTDGIFFTFKELSEWMGENSWNTVAEKCFVPVLLPSLWLREDTQTTRQQTNELVIVVKPSLRDGVLLICDTLDMLAKMPLPPISVTIPAHFGLIGGEHTGGLFLRRARRWPFDVRFQNNDTAEAIVSAHRRGAIVVLPHIASPTGYHVAQCESIGARYIALNAGGNTFHGNRSRLVRPDATSLANAIAKLVVSDTSIDTPTKSQDKVHIWLNFLKKISKRKASLTTNVKRAPLVSIIITHYERPNLLLQALNSVYQQTYSHYEVILVDDGSKSLASRELLRKLKRKFSEENWKIIITQNRYVGAARNTGVRAAKGEYIVFLDDDNALYPHAVETFVDAIIRSNSDVCTALPRSFYEDKIPVSENFGHTSYIPLGNCPDFALIANCFGDTISIYKRSIFKKVGFQLEKYGYMVEDYEFFVRVSLAGLKITVIPENLSWYRVSTQGRYRSSNYYDNQQPILRAFEKHNFSGLKLLYELFIGQNASHWLTETLKVNLLYSPSDSKLYQLANLEPNSQEAITLLANIAAEESRVDTAVSLLSEFKLPITQQQMTELLSTSNPAEAAIRSSNILTLNRPLSTDELLLMETWSSKQLESGSDCVYVEEPGCLWIRSNPASVSLAVLGAGCGSGTKYVEATISLSEVDPQPAEFAILICPMHIDPIIALNSMTRADYGFSGWKRLDRKISESTIRAEFATAVPIPHNLIFGVKAGEHCNTIGSFSNIRVHTTIAKASQRRPRIGPELHKQRAKLWSDEQRRSVKLVHAYGSDLPELLLPKTREEGIFVRPSRKGPVVVQIDRAFPAFARRLIARVEIASNDAGDFDFAVALSVPETKTVWKGDKPMNFHAFSGWYRVDERYKLVDVPLSVTYALPTSLDIQLAVKTPKNGSERPANTFFRSISFFWDD